MLLVFLARVVLERLVVKDRLQWTKELVGSKEVFMRFGEKRTSTIAERDERSMTILGFGFYDGRNLSRLKCY